MVTAIVNDYTHIGLSILNTHAWDWQYLTQIELSTLNINRINARDWQYLIHSDGQYVA